MFAESADVQTAFGDALLTNPVAAAISEEDIASDGRIRSLIRRSLVQSIAKRIGAKTDGSRRLWEAKPYRNHTSTTKRTECIEHYLFALSQSKGSRTPH